MVSMTTLFGIKKNADGENLFLRFFSALSAVFLIAGLLHAEDFDWRDIGGANFVTPVKDQSQTGMCWAFSSVAALESMYKITRNDPTYNPDLSEQQLACAGVGDAIMGGLPSLALAYFKSTGIVTEEELPFTQSNDSPLWPLSPGWKSRVYKIDAQSGLIGTVSTIKDSLKRYGPIITEMKVNQDWYGDEQGNSQVGHAVLITGFHDDPALPSGGYFIVKNSWGDSWGNEGYGKILYGTFGSYAQWMITGAAYAKGPANVLAFDTSAAPGYQAQSATWSVGSNNWSADGISLNSWRNGEDAAIFETGDGTHVINVDNNVSAHAITFQNGAGVCTLTGGSLIVTHGGITANKNVAIQSDITIGAPQQWTVADGKTLTIDGAVNTHISPLTISGDGDAVIQGVIRDIRADPAFDGLLSGFSGSLTKSGGGRLTLTAANIYTGQTKVTGGTLALSGANGSILSSAVYLTGGKLLFDNTVDNNLHRISSSVIVTLQGGELALNGHSAGTIESVYNLLLDSGNSILTVAADTNVSTMIAPRLGRNLGATALVQGTNLGSGNSGPIGQIRFTTAPTLSNDGSGDQRGIIPYLIGNNNINGPGSDLVTYGNNGLRPLTSDEYASSILANRNVRISGGQTATGAVNIRSLVLNGDGAPVQVTINNGNTLTVTSGAILSTGSFANTLSGGSITFGNNSATGYEGIVHVVEDMTIQSLIANNGSNAVSLTKSGGGMLKLLDNNTYTGGTNVGSGTLQIGNGGTTGSVVGAINNNAALLFNRSDTVIFSGAISGKGSLTKLGSNTLILTGNNNFTGVTTIADGALQIGNGGASGSIAGNVVNDGDLIFNRSVTTIYGGVISGSGRLTKLGGNIILLNNENTYTGDTIINNGTLKLGANGSLASYLIDIHAGTFNVSSISDYTLDADKTIMGQGSIFGAVTVLGTVAPGESTGVLTVGDMTFGSGSLLDIELGGTTPGTLFDVLNSTGAIDLQSGSKLRLSFLDGFAPNFGNIFDILNFSSLTGAFSTLDLPMLDGSLVWNTSNLYQYGTISVIPEPAISVMLLTALGAILSRRIIRRRVQHS